MSAVETIYLIEWGSPDRDDYMIFYIEEDHGFFLDKEKAQAFCAAKDLDRHRGPYKTYLQQHRAKENDRRQAAKPPSNPQRAMEYQVLLEAGLRKPKKPYVPREPLGFDQWVAEHTAELSTRPSWARADEWTPRYRVAEVHEA